METIRLEFQPNIKSKILELLSSFTPEELTIVQEDADFEENKRKLKICADQIDNGTVRLVSFEEMDRFLETTLSKYED